MHTENTIWTDSTQFVVAADEYEAHQKWREHTGDYWEGFYQGQWKPLPRDKKFSYLPDDSKEFVTKTVGEWADEQPDFYAFES